jgi:hypothetical protein
MRFGNVPAGYLTVPTDQAPADTTEVSSATNNRSFSVYRQVNMSVTHFAVPISRATRTRLSGLTDEMAPGPADGGRPAQGTAGAAEVQ